MLEALYRSNGYRVGLYTSPHVHRLNERIQIDRKPISDATLCKQVRRLYAIAEPAFDAENFPSFFEWITLIAFQYFNEQGIDLLSLKRDWVDDSMRQIFWFHIYLSSPVLEKTIPIFLETPYLPLPEKKRAFLKEAFPR